MDNWFRKGVTGSILIGLVLGGVFLMSPPSERGKGPPAPVESNGRASARELYRTALTPSGLLKPTAGTEPAKVATRNPAAVRAPQETPEQVSRYLAKGWLESVINYDQADRAEILEGMLDSMVQQGASAVFELDRLLSEVGVYKAPARAAIFHALGRVGASLVGAETPEATRALATIHRIAEDEFALPAYIPADPALKIATLPAGEREALLHYGTLTEKDGKVEQPTLLNKLSAIRMLRGVGDAKSLEQIHALKETDASPGVRFAVEQTLPQVAP